MKRLFVLSLMLFAFSVFGGTKEDMEKLQAEMKALEGKFNGIGIELQDIRKRLENIEMRLDAVSRSSQTADVRLDVDELKRKLEMLAIEISELTSRQTEAPVASHPQEPVKNGVPAGKETPQEIYQDAHGEYMQGRYENAVSEFQRFLTLYPDNSLAENCLYWIGESYYGLKRYEDAKNALVLTMEKYPKGAKHLSAKLKLALSVYNLGDKAESRRLLQEIVSAAPVSPESEIAKEKLKTLFPK